MDQARFAVDLEQVDAGGRVAQVEFVSHLVGVPLLNSSPML